METPGTLSEVSGGRGAHAPAEGPHLLLALECDRPLAPPLHLALARCDEVTLGRGAERAVEPIVRGGGRGFRLFIPDRWMSSSHARLERDASGWRLVDLESKNGTILNGDPVAGQAALADDDLIEIGHTLFRFCARAALVGPEQPVPGIGTCSAALAADLALVARVAPSGVPVLIEGETGTGKELVARAVHELSAREGAFVALNCGALPPGLVEGELFGYRKGAFSGAAADHLGLVRSARGGTLFLDEVGDLPPAAQITLLRALQEKEVLPLGETRPVRVDFRLVVATNRSLDAEVAAGRFRADLLGRVAGFKLRLPPLRDRREDLGLIIGALLRRIAPNGGEGITLAPAAARALFRHDWPLNVRELEKCLEAASVIAEGGHVRYEHLPAAVRRAPAPPPAAPALDAEDAHRRDELTRLLADHRGNITAVARAMGKARVQIRRWIKRYGLSRS